MKHHIGIALRYFHGMPDERLVECFPDQGTPDQIKATLADLRNEGYELVPTCDNCDDKGRCLGHE